MEHAASPPQTHHAEPARSEDRAWYDLALDLRVVTPDAMGPPGIDYERCAVRVQSSPSDPEDAMLAAAQRGAGHVRRDPVAERLERLSGRPRAVLVWLRGFAPAVDWLRVDAVQAHRGAFLDALATSSAAATLEDAQRWAVSGRQVDARRQWARLRLREAWAAWHGRAW
jgi:hypothetical protein